MRDWEKLFKTLQVLNPESDRYVKPYHTIDEEESTERWEDICFYMDTIKPKEEEWVFLSSWCGYVELE